VKTSELDKYEGCINPHPDHLPTASLGEGDSISRPHPDPLPTASLGEGDSISSHYLPTSLEQQRTIDPEILKCIIQDEQGNVYRIVKMEYDFLMKYGLPLPRKHRLDRMKENFRIN